MSDVLLVPVSTVQPDLVTQTDVVVYVPLASKTAPGIVRIGEGLTIDHTGLLNFDRSEVTIKAIAKNGVDLEIDENKRVNIVLDKSDVGLNNVDNTSDLNKPISTAVQREFDRVEGLIKGSSSAKTFTDYEAFIAAVKQMSKTELIIGQNIYVKTKNVPDLWVYDVVDEFQEFEYTDDAIIESLLVDGTLNVGYYKFAALETLKVNLDDYVTLSSRQTITGDKNFTGDLRLNGMDVATIDDVNSVTLDTLHFQPTDGSIIYANDKVYYQGEFSYTTINNDDPVTIDGTIVLPIKGDGVTISSDGSNLIIKAVIPEIDTSNLVNLDGIQTITGVKTFTEQIGILNGGDGDINYIKHLNNNFLVSSSDGENIINIDEQLKTFNFYNKPLALEEYVDDNFVSYTMSQSLTDEQKAIVRNNIGVGEAGQCGTVVTVSGVAQIIWNADSKADVTYVDTSIQTAIQNTWEASY